MRKGLRGFVDDALSRTGPLAVEKSGDFPTARPFAPYHLSCFGPLKELGKRQCAGSASQEKADAAFEPGKGTAIGFADTPMVGVGLLTGFFSVAVGLQRASSCPA